MIVDCFPNKSYPDYTPPAGGWQFAIDGGGSYGLLLARPNAYVRWGTVCHDGFNDAVAVRACRSVGFAGVSRAKFIPYTMTGRGNIYMSQFECAPSDTYLQNCSFKYSSEVKKTFMCTHDTDVVINCGSPPTPDPSEWGFRFAPGSAPGVGFVQMRQSATAAWGYICEKGIDRLSALAVCRSLGYGNVSFAFLLDGAYKAGIYYIANLSCTPANYVLGECSYTYSTPGNVWTDCTTALKLNCLGQLPTPEPVIVYTVTFSVSQQTVSGLTQDLTSMFGANRVQVLSDSTANDIVLMRFRFLDLPLYRYYLQRSRHELDYAFLYNYANSLQNLLNVLSMTSNASFWQRPTGWSVKIVGSSPFAGVIAVRPAGAAEWGVICSDEFSSAAAVVMCRASGLNVTSAMVLTRSPEAVDFTGTFYMSLVACSAMNYNIGDCSYAYSTPSQAWSTCAPRSSGVEVNCYPSVQQPQYRPPPQGWQFRVSGGGAYGLLQVRPNEYVDWGTVCSHKFNGDTAIRACRSLGFTGLAQAGYTKFKGSASGIIYMTDVVCAPGDYYLQNCSYTYSTAYAKRHSCYHFEDVWVNCGAPSTTDPSQWNFRYAPTTVAGNGLVQMRPNASLPWGSVCSDQLDATAGLALCGSLGYTNISFAMLLYPKFRLSWTVYLFDLRCSAADRYASNCSYKYSTPWNERTPCENALQLNCWGQLPPSYDLVVVFVAAIDLTVQSVQGFLSKVSSALIGSTVVHVGTTVSGTVARVSFRFANPPLWKYYTVSSGMERALALVKRLGYYTRRLNAINITSNGSYAERPSTWNVRIVGSSPFAGLLQVRPGPAAAWGTVCSDGFNNNTAVQFCWAAGLDVDKAMILTQRSLIISGSGTVYIDNISCAANGRFPQNCRYMYSTPAQTWNRCTNHKFDVNVNCFPDTAPPYYTPPPSSWQFMLKGGGAAGLLLVRPSAYAMWGTVCDDRFNFTTALRACRSLGYTSLTQAGFMQKSEIKTGTIYMDDVVCGPADYYLQNCSFLYSTEYTKRHNCYHFEDVWLNCRPTDPTDTAKWMFRLDDTAVKGRGLLLMRPNASAAWGTVSSSGFTPDAALAACHSVGYLNVNIAYGMIGYFSGNGTVYLSNIGCSASTFYLQKCSYTFNTATNPRFKALHRLDVGLDCRDTLVPTTQPTLTPTSSTSRPPSTPGAAKRGPSGGVAAGVVVGLLALIGIAVAAVIFVRRRRASAAQDDDYMKMKSETEASV